MKNYLVITVPVKTPETKEILIALLSDICYDGFEEKPDTLKAYIPEEQYDEESIHAILKNFDLGFSIEELEHKNWNEEWESSFNPVIVGDFCAIRAGFHSPNKNVEHEIIITPKMSFGTGHHATTFMMVEAMQKINFHDKEVADFGTGTAVLAILAERLGAKRIAAIDNDDYSIENAVENIDANGSKLIELIKNDILLINNKLDVILANINRNVLLASMASIEQHLKGGGVLLLSGILAGDKGQIIQSAESNNMILASENQKDGWVLLKFLHK